MKEDGKEFVFFIFNDMVMKTKENGKKLKVIGTPLFLLTANVADINDKSNSEFLVLVFFFFFKKDCLTRSEKHFSSIYS